MKPPQLPGELRSFQHTAPALRIFQGADSLVYLQRELDRVASQRAVVLCGSTLARPGSPLDLVRQSLGSRLAGVVEGVQAHSPLPAVEAAARELQRLAADAVIAVGGGSAIVTARAASILAAEGTDAAKLGTARDEHGVLRSPKLLAPKLPQFVIPTTPTTAAPKAGSAVFDPVAGKRLALFDPKTRAKAIFVHPAFVQSAPPDLVISASLNTLTLTLEGLLSHAGDPIADALLMHAVRLIAQHLPGLRETDNAAVRADLVQAALLGGMGTDYTSAGIAIALGHAVSARCHVDNGLANAILLPHTLRFNADAGQAGLKKMATALGLPPTAGTERVIEAVQATWAPLGLPTRLEQVGVAADELPGMADSVMDDWFLQGNVRRVVDARELVTVLRQAW